MRLTFLGTSSGTPTRDRNVTGLAIRGDDGRIIIVDCGEGTQHRLLLSDLSPGAIDTILITHLHGDHCYGLFGLLASLAVHHRQGPVQVFGPPGMSDMVRAVMRLSYLGVPYPLHLTDLPVSGDDCVINGWTIRARPLIHRVPCLGYVIQEADAPGRFDADAAQALGIVGPARGRIVAGHPVTLDDGRVIGPADLCGPPRPGRKIAVLGDTRDSRAIAEAARNCDVLVQESTYDHSLLAKAIEWGHSTATMAGTFAHQVGAAHLVLTHFSSRYSTANSEEPSELTIDDLQREAAAACPGTTVHCATDLASARLGRREPGLDQPPTLTWEEPLT